MTNKLLKDEELNKVSGGEGKPTLTLALFVSIIKDHCDDDVDENSKFCDLYLDELDAIDIEATIEYEYGINVSLFNYFSLNITLAEFYYDNIA